MYEKLRKTAGARTYVVFLVGRLRLFASAGEHRPTQHVCHWQAVWPCTLCPCPCFSKPAKYKTCFPEEIKAVRCTGRVVIVVTHLSVIASPTSTSAAGKIHTQLTQILLRSLLYIAAHSSTGKPSLLVLYAFAGTFVETDICHTVLYSRCGWFALRHWFKKTCFLKPRRAEGRGGGGWTSSVAYTIKRSIIYKTRRGSSRRDDRLQAESSPPLSPLTQVFIDHLTCHPIAV